MKRQRGRGRKPGHHNSANRTFDSTGPEGKGARGSAAHLYEKYLHQARDANSSGDRVLAENYLQHAEHYYRLLRASQPQQTRAELESQFNGDYDSEGLDEDGGFEAEVAPAPAPLQPPRQERGERPPREQRVEREPRPEREREREREPVEAREEEGEEAEGDVREAAEGPGRRGRRRRRFRPGEGREGGAPAGEERAVEGFGDQLPAFVTGS